MTKRLNRYKAFTIVELAIVLVVIGIILGMAVKGKALVDTARMKAEVAKLNKFEAAFATYYALRNERLPEVSPEAAASGGPDDKINFNTFTDMGLLTMADFHEKINDLYWLPFRCRSYTDGTRWESWATSTHACIIGVREADFNTLHTGFFIQSPNPSKRFICNIEVIKDDENRSSGYGRSLHPYNISDTPTDIANYADCDNYTDADVNLIYVYRVF